MKIGETDRFGVQAVKVWSFKDRVSVTAKISISLIIGYNDDYIGFFCICIPFMKKVQKKKQKEKFEELDFHKIKVKGLTDYLTTLK